jgi:FtsZ-binding cell division protein ZapB
MNRIITMPRVVAVVGLLALGACASQSEFDELKAELARAQTEASEANQRASAAEQRAAAAEEAARAAQERADRIFRESLRK